MIKHTKYKFKHHLRCFIIFNVGTVFNQVLLSVQLGATTCSLGNAPTVNLRAAVQLYSCTAVRTAYYRCKSLSCSCRGGRSNVSPQLAAAAADVCDVQELGPAAQNGRGKQRLWVDELWF